MPLDNLERFDESNCWLGGPQMGKTRALAAHACSLARSEDEPGARRKSVVLFLCATPAGLTEAQTYIEENLRSANLSVRVELVRTIALDIMAEPVAQALFGRKPRVLDAFEERFLLEDTRTTRFKGRRLREVMEFLRGGWSRLADDDEEWLITLEEEAIAAVLRDSLRFTGGIMACELGNLAVNTLRSDADVRERHAATHVLVDDYPLLDRASQILVRMLAEKSFSFSGDSCPTLLTFDDFPYPQGIDEFLKAYPHTKVRTLENKNRPALLAQTVLRLQKQSERLLEQQKGAQKNFRARYAELMKQSRQSETNAASAEEAPKTPPHIDPSDPMCVPQVSSSPKRNLCRSDIHQQAEQPPSAPSCLEAHMEDEFADELGLIIRICRQAVNTKEDVLVVGANGLWRKRVLGELRRANLPVFPIGRRLTIRDFRDEKGCTQAYTTTLARLRNDPHDGVAWRSLIGFGDYMARSAGLEKVREAALRCGLGIEEALARLAEGTLEGVSSKDPLCGARADAYEQSLKALSALDAADPDTLLKKAEKPDFSGLDADKDSLAQEVTFGHGGGRVAVCAPRDATGLQVPTVIFGGFINGMIPSRAHLDAGGLTKEVPLRKQAEDLSLIRSVLGRASKRVVVTGFLRCGLEEAERMELSISRIKLHRGMRVCATQPSIYLDTLIDTEKPLLSHPTQDSRLSPT